jgi:hypothetical protein
MGVRVDQEWIDSLVDAILGIVLQELDDEGDDTSVR